MTLDVEGIPTNSPKGKIDLPDIESMTPNERFNHAFMQQHPDIISSAQSADLADQEASQNVAPAGKKRSVKKIPVIELFGPTIEGEGAVIGKQTMFLRTGLCDYACSACDSMHAVNPQMVKQLANWMTQEEIVQAVLKDTPKHIKTITFSGGNPAIHNLTYLTHELQQRGFEIVVETQGTKHPEWLHLVDHLVISPKSPGMGTAFDPQVFETFMSYILGSDVEYSIKIVVFTNQDLEFAVGIAGLLDKIFEEAALSPDWKDRFYLSQGNPVPPVFSIGENGEVINDSPANNALVEKLLKEYNNLSGEILKDPRLSFARFLPQLHVLIWGNETGK